MSQQPFEERTSKSTRALEEESRRVRRRRELEERRSTREEEPTGLAIHTSGQFTFEEFTYRGELSEWTRVWDPRLTLTRRDQIAVLQAAAAETGLHTPVGRFTMNTLFDPNLWTIIEDFLGEPPLRASFDVTSGEAVEEL